MNSLTKTREQVLQSLARDPNINQNWLREEARKRGIDFDDHYDIGEPLEVIDY